MQIVMVIDGHDWKERVTYHPAPSYRIERHSGELFCYDCGTIRPRGHGPETPCYAAWSKLTGLPAIPLD